MAAESKKGNIHVLNYSLVIVERFRLQHAAYVINSNVLLVEGGPWL